MLSSIYLEPHKVPDHLRGGYTGKKFRVYVVERMTIPADNGVWDSGSRDVYRVARTSDGLAIGMPDQQAAPWDSVRKDREVVLQPGYCVVRHSIVSGKDSGLCFYLCPQDAAPMLPAPAAELDAVQKLVLDYTSGRKSSYNGKDRFDMAKDDFSYSYNSSLKVQFVDGKFPTRADWDEAKLDLAARGLLTKAGAITPAGRNQATRI